MQSITIYKIIIGILTTSSFLIFLFLIKKKLISIIYLGTVCLFWIAYGYIIEPNLLFINKSTFQTGFKLKIGFISDLHIGDYSNKSFTKKLIEKINEQDIDVLLVGGDWSYYNGTGNFNERIKSDFNLFSRLKVPCYGIWGNHDLMMPGPNIQEALKSTLNSHNITILNNQIIRINNVNIVGFGELRKNDFEKKLINNFNQNDNVILLTHNPDSLTLFSNGEKNIYDIALAGHTHGGQIKLPFLYKYFLPTQHTFVEGFYKEYKLFITSGIGNVGLPMRFLNPPKIEIIEFK